MTPEKQVAEIRQVLADGKTISIDTIHGLLELVEQQKAELTAANYLKGLDIKRERQIARLQKQVDTLALSEAAFNILVERLKGRELELEARVLTLQGYDHD